MEETKPKNGTAIIPEEAGNARGPQSTDTTQSDSLKVDNTPNTSGENGNPKKEQQESTRSKLALLFVLGFFAVLFLCFIFALLTKASLGELKDILVAVVGALAGIFGFIVGYYYKSSTE